MLLNINRIRSKTPALKQLCREHKSLLTQRVLAYYLSLNNNLEITLWY